MEKFMAFLWRLVGIISVVVIMAFVWLYFFVPTPQTTSTTYVNALTLYDDEETPLEDATIVSEINYYSNANDNGTALFEWLLTTYQGTNYDEVYSKGIQVFGDFNTSSYASYKTTRWSGLWGLLQNFNLWYDLNIDNLYSYDISYDDDEATAFASPTALNNNSSFIVSVGSGDNATLAMLKFRNEVVSNENFKETWFGLYGTWLTNWYDYDLIGLNYTISSLYKTVSSLDAGTYYLTIDLSQFFDVYVENDDGQFIEQTTDTQYTYVTCKINVSDDGMTTSSQSLYGMVADNDGSVTFDVDDTESLFWKTEENVTLTDADLTLRYSNYYDGYLLSISNDSISYYKDFDDLRIHLVIDLSGFDDGINIIGIDSTGLDGLDYYDITVENGEQDFYFMSNSLSGVNVNAIYYTDGVNLVIYDVDITTGVVQ